MSDKDIVKGHISTRGMSAALDLAAAFGVNPRSILQRCGIQTERLALPDSQVPVSDYLHFLRLLRQQSGNADMGLYLGRISHLENMHLFMYLASTSGTMRDWLNRLPSVSARLGRLRMASFGLDDLSTDFFRSIDFAVIDFNANDDLRLAVDDLRVVAPDDLLLWRSSLSCSPKPKIFWTC